MGEGQGKARIGSRRDGLRSPVALDRQNISHRQCFDIHRTNVMDVNQRPIEMTSDELFARTALNSWKQVVSRFSTAIEPLTGEQLQKQVAPGKNRLLYLVGHLTAIHDRMFPLLGIGERLHPELDAVYIDNPDRSAPDPLSPAQIKNAWSEVNARLTAAFEKYTPAQWLEKHTAVSE